MNSSASVFRRTCVSLPTKVRSAYQGQCQVIKTRRSVFNTTSLLNYLNVSACCVTTSASVKRNFATMADNTNSSQGQQEGNSLVAKEEVRRFMVDCFLSQKTPQKYAEIMADLLVAADDRGHFSHGMNRLEMYINDLAKGSTVGSATPTVISCTPSTAWVDGNNGLGGVVGTFCMELAMEMAAKVGVGWVCAKRSNHFGIAGWYTLMALERGLVGMAFTNTSPLMAPTRSITAGLGTNPISMAAPAHGDDSFVLDMATTAVAVGKIEINLRKDLPIPEGWAQDPSGNVTTDANLAYDTACLMPLGGAEITSGYKGYGLGAMVEILCGVMAGANFGTGIRKWGHSGSETEANLGQCFIAVNPDCFAPGFRDRMSTLMSQLRDCEPADTAKPVLVAGDPERIHMEQVKSEGGIRYLPNQIKTCLDLSKRLGVEPLMIKSI